MLVLVPAGFTYFGAAGGICGLVTAELFRYAVLADGARDHGLPGPLLDLAHSALPALSAAAGLAASSLAGDLGSPWLRLLCAVGGVLTVWLPVAGIVLRREVAQAMASVRARSSNA
jgi:hypothetical protein